MSFFVKVPKNKGTLETQGIPIYMHIQSLNSARPINTQPRRGSKDEQNRVEEQPRPADRLQLQAAKEPRKHLEKQAK